MLLSFGHSEDSLDPEDSSNCLKKFLEEKNLASIHTTSSNSPQNQLGEEAYQHALGEGHHSLVRGTSLK